VKVLVADDEEPIRDLLRLALEAEGHSVMLAADGAEALRAASSERPDVILLDLKMPVMDGWQFLAERAKDAAARETPVVLLSGLPFIPNAPGVADFLSKPINPARVIDCVRRFCGVSPGVQGPRSNVQGP
jgi:CheY-like chemotaxis protein